jgi:cob(I)alamin adenosyltransferase
MKLHNIYTGSGNFGETSLIFNTRVSKAHVLIETNQYINLFKLNMGKIPHKLFDNWIEMFQEDMNIVMGYVVASYDKESVEKYIEKFNPDIEGRINKAQLFIDVIKELDIAIDGWVDYNNEDSLPYFECSEYCRLAEIYLVKSQEANYHIPKSILEYFNMLNKILFMMGFCIHTITANENVDEVQDFKEKLMNVYDKLDIDY